MVCLGERVGEADLADLGEADGADEGGGRVCEVVVVGYGLDWGVEDEEDEEGQEAGAVFSLGAVDYFGMAGEAGGEAEGDGGGGVGEGVEGERGEA